MKPRQIVFVVLLALAAGVVVYSYRTAQAAAPTPQIQARLSVPPLPELPNLQMAIGFAPQVTNPAPGVYHLFLEAGLQFTALSNLTCSCTKPDATCSLEILPPVNPATEPYTEVVLYRTRGGVAENGDAWLRGSI